jgi:hypothetical protein
LDGLIAEYGADATLYDVIYSLRVKYTKHRRETQERNASNKCRHIGGAKQFTTDGDIIEPSDAKEANDKA